MYLINPYVLKIFPKTITAQVTVSVHLNKLLWNSDVSVLSAPNHVTLLAFNMIRFTNCHVYTHQSYRDVSQVVIMNGLLIKNTYGMETNSFIASAHGSASRPSMFTRSYIMLVSPSSHTGKKNVLSPHSLENWIYSGPVPLKNSNQNSACNVKQQRSTG